MKYLLIFYFSLITFFINVNATENVRSQMKNPYNDFSHYITASSEQICITHEGMYVHFENELLPIYTLHAYGPNKYRCHLDFHHILNDLVTCEYCGLIYDSVRDKTCPNKFCPQMH